MISTNYCNKKYMITLYIIVLAFNNDLKKKFERKCRFVKSLDYDAYSKQ